MADAAGESGAVIDSRCGAAISKAVGASGCRTCRIGVGGPAHQGRRRIRAHLGISGALPFVIGRQSFPVPATVRGRFVKGDVNGRFVVPGRHAEGRRPYPAGLLLPSGRVNQSAAGFFGLGDKAGCPYETAELADRDFRAIDHKGIDPLHAHVRQSGRRGGKDHDHYRERQNREHPRKPLGHRSQSSR